MAIQTLLASLLLVTGATQALRDRPLDTLVLTSGRSIEGHLVRQDEEEVTWLVRTRQQTYPRAQVERVESAVLHLSEFARRVEGAAAADARANLEVAAWAKEVGLLPEAELMAWRVLARDFENEAAHTFLGHRQRGNAWQVQLDRRWLDQRRFETAIADWRSAFEYHGSLYHVRSNLPLAEGIERMLLLNRVYADFFELFGDRLGFPHASLQLEVHLHRESRSFPAVGRGNPAYFLADANRVVIDGERATTQGPLIRQAVQQILFATYRNHGSGTGSPPGWLAIGLAAMMEAALDGPGFDARRLLRPRTNWFEIHAGARDPFSLNRVLNFAADDFEELASTEVRYAQAYTLIHYCLEGDEGRLAGPFKDFVRGTMEARMSPTHFKNALGVSDDARFESAWQAHAAARAAERPGR